MLVSAAAVNRLLADCLHIRGVVPTTLNADVARAVGRAFGTRAMQLGSRTVAVGRDGRLSGPELASALVAGLLDAGVQGPWF